MIDKKLGKIESVRFGHGGYQDAMIGIHVTLAGKGWGVNDSRCFWAPSIIECHDNAQWTEEDRSSRFADNVRYIDQLLEAAKKRTIDQLVGVPIEASFTGNTLTEWRVLTEVI